MKVKVTIIGGKVHDVGYRLFLLDLADSLLIERFDARNVFIEGKQAVVVLVEGDEKRVKQFIELVKENKPESAVVEDIKVEDYDGFVRTIDSYRNSLMINQLNKIVQVGLKMLEKMDDLGKKVDETKEYLGTKTDDVGKKVDNLGEKIDDLGKKMESAKEYLGTRIDKVGEKIDALRVDLREYFDQRLKRIEEDIEKIKLKLGMT
jgi:acylphosphatase